MTILERYVELHPESARLHGRASTVFPDGVTHDMRRASPFPLYVSSASGSRKRDVDGHEIIDYVMGHGSLLLGHNDSRVVEAAQQQLKRGTHYGASHESEIRWGEQVQRLMPSAERVRFTSSGTEATMMAVRLARAFTGRDKLLRLREHFHGWNDSVTGQPATAEDTVPADSPGIPAAFLGESIVIPQNDVDALERTLDESGDVIAALIFEATGAHWGTEPIDIEYARRMRELTQARGVLLIFDEVITGFRVSAGGAQEEFGIKPDMTTLAKILGGGLPGGAVVGRADVIDQIAVEGRSGRVSHPGTYNANPLSAAAGTACLEIVADGTQQDGAAATATAIARALNAVFRDESVPGCVYGVSSMLHVALGCGEQPDDGVGYGWRPLPFQLPTVSPAAAQALRLGMINEGVDLMAGGLMVSSAHTDEDVRRTSEAFRSTLRAMKEEKLL
jgi:glutamate-1-semialdehyde 2,1-aminomutase